MALDRFLAGIHRPREIPDRSRTHEYPQLARAALAGNLPGPSAQGEQPKFTASILTDGATRQVLVKFSPPRDNPSGARWADLLMAEHMAHRVLADAGILAVDSRILQLDDRVYLETDRFDRIGATGRRGVASLLAVDSAFYGRLDNWAASAQRLLTSGLLDAVDARRLQLLDAFGALIANTDRHFGNITLFDDYSDPFSLAPVYDMLPMLFAPHDEQLMERQFEPPRVTAATLGVWQEARRLALDYWSALASHEALSREFRAISQHALEDINRNPS